MPDGKREPDVVHVVGIGGILDFRAQWRADDTAEKAAPFPDVILEGLPVYFCRPAPMDRFARLRRGFGGFVPVTIGAVGDFFHRAVLEILLAEFFVNAVAGFVQALQLSRLHLAQRVGGNER